MNINGRPLPFLLRTLSASHPLPTYAPPTLIALHDNLTLHPLTVGKPRIGVSAQGHGGLSSIESSLKTKDFWRLGLGIGRGGNAPGDGGVVKWVLSELGRDEKAFWEAEGVDRVAEVVEGMVDKLKRGDTGKGKGKK
jgi:PTH1 family peptidyl-tRNA hydrolase